MNTKVLIYWGEGDSFKKGIVSYDFTFCLRHIKLLGIHLVEGL